MDLGLTKQRDLDLIRSIKRGINTDFCLKEIIQRHSGAFVDAVKMFGSSLPTNDANEFMQEKDYHIYKAAMNYDENKNAKFSTYLFYSAKWGCLSKKVKNSREVETVSFQEIFKDNADQENFEFKIQPKSRVSPRNSLEKIENRDILNSVFKILAESPDPRVEKIFTLRYKEGKKNKVMPWKNVAERVGNLTAQRCIDIHNNTLEFLKNKIVKYEQH